MDIKIKIRIGLWVGLLGIVAWLFFMAVVPDGKIKYETDFLGRSDFFGKLTPIERVKLTEEGKPVIVGDPVYFNLRTPRKFDRAKLSLKFKEVDDVGRDSSAATPQNDRGLIEAGVLVDNVLWRYDTRPVENMVLERLGMVWNQIREGDVLFLQKEKKFNSVDEFLASSTDMSKVGVYNYDLKKEFLLPDYEAADKKVKPSSLNNFHPLVGSFEFYTYIKDEDLSFDFSLLDLNKNKEADKVEVIVYYENNIIESFVSDDAVGDKEEKLREIKAEIKNLPEGVYKVEFRAKEDIVTEDIVTKQTKIAFAGKLDFYKQTEGKWNIFTDSKRVSAKTIYPDRLQIMTAGDNSLELAETYKQYDFDISRDGVSEKIITMALPGDGIFLAGDGLWSFSKNNFFNPRIMRVTNDSDIMSEGIEYVLANYVSPEKDGDWKTKTIDIDLSNAYREKGKYSFLISIPGLLPDDGQGIEIDEISIELEGKSLMEKLREKF